MGLFDAIGSLVSAVVDAVKALLGFKEAKKDTDKNFDKKKDPKCTKESCPLEDKWKLVELVEVITQGGKDVRIPVSGRKQYINLDPNGDPSAYKKEYGRKIRLQARVEWQAGDPSRSLAGKPTYWYTKAGGSNRAGLKGTMRHGLGSSGTEKKSVSTDAEGWTSVVELILSKYGSDSFDAFVTDDAGYTGGMKAGTFEVWRKLYYELDCMKRSGGGSFSDRADEAGLKSEFLKQYLELEKTGTDNAPAFERLVGDGAADAWATKYRDGKGAPRYFHLVLMDTIAWDPKPVTDTFELSGSYVVTLAPATYLFDPTSWLVSATYLEAGTGKTGPLTTAQLTLSQTGSPSGGDEKVTITLDASGLGLDPKNKVTLTITYSVWSEGSGLQVPTGPATIIGMRWRERAFNGANLTKSTLNTMMHEPGHAMGLASTTLPDQTACPTTYYKAGHHCNNLSNGCVMYEANSVSTAFCPKCADALKGRDLESLPRSGSAAFS